MGGPRCEARRRRRGDRDAEGVEKRTAEDGKIETPKSSREVGNGALS